VRCWTANTLIVVAPGLSTPVSSIMSTSVAAPASTGSPAVNESEVKEADRRASFAETFSQADWFDYVLMFFGTLGGLITGLSIPFFNILFGRMLDNLNGSPNSFSQTIDSLCIAFAIVAACNLLSGWMQVAFWTRTGERQTQRFRENYVKAILSQEIGWFDTSGANELSTKVAELTGKIQGMKHLDKLRRLFYEAPFRWNRQENWRLDAVRVTSYLCIPYRLLL
jgi:ABC-type multidrug transport system fused ATPase/permease subunit